MPDLITEYCRDPLQCLCWGDNPRLLQLAVGLGFVAVGGGERHHDQVVAPTRHLLQPAAWGRCTRAAQGHHRASHQAHYTGKTAQPITTFVTWTCLLKPSMISNCLIMHWQYKTFYFLFHMNHKLFKMLTSEALASLSTWYPGVSPRDNHVNEAHLSAIN